MSDWLNKSISRGTARGQCRVKIISDKPLTLTSPNGQMSCVLCVSDELCELSFGSVGGHRFTLSVHAADTRCAVAAMFSEDKSAPVIEIRASDSDVAIRSFNVIGCVTNAISVAREGENAGRVTISRNDGSSREV